MKIDHKTMLDAFEETGGRGDALTLSRDSLVTFANVPFEVFAPIFHQLFKWFVNGDETALPDPLSNAMLEGMKEHQRRNAVKRRAFLVAQSEKIANRWKNKSVPRNTTVCHGMPNDTEPYQVKAKAKAEAKEEAIAKDSSFASGGTRKGRAADAALAVPLSVNRAKKFLAMNAPQIASLPEMQTMAGKPTGQCLEILQKTIPEIVRLVGEHLEAEAQTFDAPILAVCRLDDSTDAESAYRRVLVKAMFDAEDDAVKNPPAFVIARVKECHRALLALNPKN